MAVSVPVHQLHVKSRWPAFFGWMIVGACGILGILEVFTIGWIALVVGIAATILLVYTKQPLVALTGLISGGGVPLLIVGYLNRQGPGTVCTSSGSGTECDTYFYSSAPILIGGLVLVALGLVLCAVLGRSKTTVS